MPATARFGPFEIVSRLGVGGMGEVFLAQRDGERVALKLIRPEFARDPRFLRLFANEAEIGARLHHDNLVRVLDHGTSDGVSWLALELVDGVSLDRLVEDGQFSVAAVASVGARLGAGLAYAHGLGLLHRDVSCSNVLVSVSGDIKLTDFGIGRADGQTTSTQSLKGKRAYLPPEVWRNGPSAFTAAGDIFSCGVVLYRLVTGKLPFEDSLAWARGEASLSIAGPLAPVIARALDADPARRLPSAVALRDALLSHASDDAVAELRARVALVERARAPLPMLDQLILAELQPASSPPTRAPLVPSRGRSRWQMLGAGGVVLLLAVLGIALLRKPRATPARATALAPATTTPTTTEPPPSEPPKPTPVIAAGPIAPKATRPAHHASARTGLLTLDTEPWGTAYLGARRLGVTPLSHVPLPAGHHQLVLDVRDSGDRRPIDVEVTAGSETRLSLHLPAAATASHR